MKGDGLLRFVIGYVDVTAKGGWTERLSDEMFKRGLEPFNLMVRNDTLFFSIRADRYAILRPIARRCQCRVRIAEKHSLLLLLKRNRDFHCIASGAAVFALTLFLLGKTVFEIEVKGLHSIPEREFIAELADCGLRCFILRDDVDTDAVSLEMLLKRSELSRVSINLGYGRAVVEVLEKTPVPEIDAGRGENVYADCDGKITSVSAYGGVPAVKVGDTVHKGDLLLTVTETRMSKSWTKSVWAEVRAVTDVTAEFVQPKTVETKIKTGKCIVKKSLITANGVRVSADPRKIPEGCDSLTYIKELYLFGVRLPFKMQITEYTEHISEIRSINTAQAKKLLDEAEQDFIASLDKGSIVLGRKSQSGITDDGYTRTVFYRVERDICHYPDNDNSTAE